MALISAGILVFKRTGSEIEFLLVHPGGPFFMKKENGYWTIPKGLVVGEEKLIEAAKREFAEETGIELKAGIQEFITLGNVVQKGGKIVHGFALEMALDVTQIKSNVFELEWPPRSGVKKEFPEVDRADWFTLRAAKLKINLAQYSFLERLMKLLEGHA